MLCDYGKEQCVEVCAPQKFTTDVRKQFQLETDADTVCAILEALGEDGINLFGSVTYVSNSNGKTGLIFVPGQEEYQSNCSVKCSMAILNKFGVKYEVVEVVVVTPSTRLPGTFAQLFCALNKCMVVDTSYSTSNGDKVFQVSSVEKAVRIINRLK